MKTKIKISFGLLKAFALGLLLNRCSTPGCTVPATNHVFRADSAGYGRNATIDVNIFDGVKLRRGDTVYLDFPCPVSKPSSLPADLEVTVKGNRARVVYLEPTTIMQTKSLTAGAMTVSFPSPAFTFKVYNANDDVWPGDANADGRRNMLDLYAITECMWPPVSNQPNAANRIAINDLIALNELHPVADWPNQSFTWMNQAVNMKHADCNLDGTIDSLDIRYLMAVIEPMYLPEFMTDAMGGFKLKATIDPAAYNSAPFNRNPVIGANNEILLDLPFNIDVHDVAAPGFTPPADGILGFIFTRAVTETDLYNVNSTFFEYSTSTLFSPTDTEMVWRQRYFDDVAISFSDGQCVDATDKALDVGMFKIKMPGNPPVPGNRIGRCGVTLEDVLCPTGVPSLQAYLHTLNGILFYLDDNGELQINEVECSSDTTSVATNQFCPADIALRDGLGDPGLEPNTDDAHAWASPDIWVRNSNDGQHTHQRPVNGATNFVNVRVFNRSCNPMNNVAVNVYWTAGATGENWSRDFGTGHLIGTITIPSIAKWSSATASIAWNVPSGFWPTGSGTSCFQEVTIVAVASVSTDPAPAFPPNNLRPWVLSSNNVAAHSLLALNSSMATGGGNCAGLRLTNPLVNTPVENVKLVIEQVGGLVDFPASHFGSFLVRDVNSAIVNPTLDQITQSGNKYLLQAEATRGSIGFSMASNLDQPLEISFTQSVPVPANQPRTYRFRIYLVDEGKSPAQVYNSNVFEITLQP